MFKVLKVIILCILFTNAYGDTQAKQIGMESFPGRLMLMISEEPELYWEYAAASSKYQKDYFGLLKIRTQNKQTLLDDMGLLGELKMTESHAISLKSDSCDFKIFLDVDLARKGEVIESGASYIWLNWGTDSRLLVECLEKFDQYLRANGLQKKYLYDNTYYNLQLKTEKNYNLDTSTIEIPSYSNSDDVRENENGVVIVPDYRHGDVKRYEQLLQLLEELSPEWFGVEMYPQYMQADIDIFLSEPENSEKFEKAKQKLISVSWTQLNPGQPKTEKNKYFKLLEIAKTKGIKVVALDSERIFSLWNHGEIPFGVAVRNYMWAEVIPSSGIGVVFGGSGHFAHYTKRAVNFQDYLADKYDSPMYLFQ